jgi:hypothetical protein
MAFIMVLSASSMLDWSAVFLVDKSRNDRQECGQRLYHLLDCDDNEPTRWELDHSKARTQVDHIGGALVAAGGFCLVTSQANPAGPVFGFAMIGLSAANVVPLIFSLASESGGALGNNISYVAMLGYSGVLTGPAVIGFSRTRGDLGRV